MKNQVDVAIVGNINIDLVLSNISDLPDWGKETIVDNCEYRCAGAATYTAEALSNLDISLSLLSACGDDALGQKLLECFNKNSINSKGITIVNAPTGISVSLVNSDSDRAFITHLGHLAHIDFEMITANLDSFTDPKFVLICGFFLMPKLRPEILKLIELLRSKGATILLDTGWDPHEWTLETRDQLNAIFPLVDVFLPNELEAKAITMKSKLIDALSEFINLGITLPIIKLGPRGAATIEDGEIIYVSPPVVHSLIVDTTGAGDIFNAGVIYALKQDFDITNTLRFATTLATLAIQHPRTGISISDVLQIVEI